MNTNTVDTNGLELEQIAINLEYGYGNVIAKNDNYVITKPLNTWDTNYRIYDNNDNVVYLVDCEDVQRNESDLDEYGGILYQELLSLNMESIRDTAWKVEKKVA